MTPTQRPSVLLIAVEGLGRDALLCGESLPSLSGVQILCQDSVRFTHAFTTSPLSQPALASLMTGQWPLEHGVWDNGATYLTGYKETVAEVALKLGYRTAFFSGGAPIWSKSGLGQGFEVFDDFIDIAKPPVYREVADNLTLFEDWWVREVNRQPFFAVIYLADLQFDEVATTDDLGVVRESSFEGQVKEVDESLGTLFKSLKTRGLWDSLNVILVGLNGHAERFVSAGQSGSNLNSDNVRVGLMIKPARKPRDESLQWKIDANVSLVDVGRTLYSIFASDSPASRLEGMEVIDLKNVLANPQVTWPRERLIMTASAWPEWRDLGGIRFGFRRGGMALLYDDPPQIFNTLTDRHETVAIPLMDPNAARLLNDATAILRPHGFVPAKPSSRLQVEKNRLGAQLWRRSTQETHLAEDLARLQRELPKDQQVLGWLADLALRTKDWPRLLALGKTASRKDWMFVAEKNRGGVVTAVPQGCLALFVAGKAAFQEVNPRECDDQVFLDLMAWYFAERGEGKEILAEKFFRSYRLLKLRDYIYQMNYTRGLVWDVNIAEPSGPSLTRLVLALPEFSQYARIAEQRTLRHN